MQVTRLFRHRSIAKRANQVWIFQNRNAAAFPRAAEVHQAAAARAAGLMLTCSTAGPVLLWFNDQLRSNRGVSERQAVIMARTSIVKRIDIQPVRRVAMPCLNCVNTNNASWIETVGPLAWISPCQNRRLITIIVGAMMSLMGVLTLSAYGNDATNVGAKQSPERAWVEEADRLVQLAGTSNADAAQYKRDVLASRKQLRALMPPGPNFYSGENRLPSPRQQLLSRMIVLDALLKSAAACQTVGRIVCPATLMSQLHTTLASVRSDLDAYEATLTTTSSGKSTHDRNP